MIVYANGKVLGTDENGDTQPVSVTGPDKDELKVSDPENTDLLVSVVRELKLLNLQMMIMTDMDLSKQDVEVN